MNETGLAEPPLPALGEQSSEALSPLGTGSGRRGVSPWGWGRLNVSNDQRPARLPAPRAPARP